MAKPSQKVQIDMTGVESSVLIPEGDYTVKVVEVTKEIGESSNQPYLKWKFAVVGGQFEGQTLYHNTSLQPKALFNLRKVLVSLGEAVPNGILTLELDKLPGKVCGVTAAHETYEGKTRAKPADFFPLEGGAVDAEPTKADEDVAEMEDEDEDL